jgi:hypothetical protein
MDTDQIPHSGCNQSKAALALQQLRNGWLSRGLN